MALVAWGRTDAGVHAKGAVVTIDLTGEEVILLSKKSCCDASFSQTEAASQFLLRVLKQFACNTGVSDGEGKARFGSISALRVTAVPLSFDARYSALWKRYVYYICSGDTSHSLPFAWMSHAWCVKKKLDVNEMTKAAELLSGKEHNYEWLSVVQEGELRDSRRTVQLTVKEVILGATSQNDVPYFLEHHNTVKLYKVTATSDFFLYKMMRRIVGMLVSIGKGHANVDCLAACVQAHDVNNDEVKEEIPKELVETAPAHGLCLDHVEYGIAL